MQFDIELFRNIEPNRSKNYAILYIIIFTYDRTNNLLFIKKSTVKHISNPKKIIITHMHSINNTNIPTQRQSP